MSDYILNANTSFIYLKENVDSFYKEAKIIDEAKCYLVNYGNLDDFEYDDLYVYETGGGYDIVSDEFVVHLEVEDKMIKNYLVE